MCTSYRNGRNTGIRNWKDVEVMLQSRGDDAIEPDWGSVIIDSIPSAWSEDDNVVKASFTDPLLHGYEVTIIEDTLPLQSNAEPHAIDPERITTMVMRFPRCILPELNTHRVFSRNSASSRARSFRTTIEPIMEDAYLPLFTRNQKGMGGEWVDKRTFLTASRYWLQDRDYAVTSALRLLLGDKFIHNDVGVGNWDASYPNLVSKGWRDLVDEYMKYYRDGDAVACGMPSIHKQNVNRLLEPFMWHEALVTSTYWQNFLDLRISDAAMPEIKALAILVRAALESSTPERSWVHLPFGDKQGLEDASADWDRMSDILMTAASECARISYKDRSQMQNRNDSALGRRLLADKHMSPFEHIAFDAASAPMESVGFRNAMDGLGNRDLSSNLSPEWVQYRRVVSAREQ